MRKINNLCGRLGWSVKVSVIHDGVLYDIVIEPTDAESQRFKIRHNALVFVLRAAKKAGLLN